MIEVVRKYKISSHSVLHKWIKIYNSHTGLKGTRKRMGNSMTKGRSTKLEERLEIVKYCIENGKDYNQTAQRFKVSYQQVYQWVKKYIENGQKVGLVHYLSQTKGLNQFWLNRIDCIHLPPRSKLSINEALLCIK